MTITAPIIANTVDCRGQRCPAPILATAKAARALGALGGGLLEVAADDEAFPFDIRSWCRSSGAELVELHTEGVEHTAILRVAGRAARGTPPPPRLVSVPSPAAKAPPRPAAAQAPPRIAADAPPRIAAGAPPRIAAEADRKDDVGLLDCRGRTCPEPILGLARWARALGSGTTIDVLADDPSFEADLETWCRSTGTELLSVAREGDALRARIRLGSAEAAANLVQEAAVRLSPPPAAATVSQEPVSLLGVEGADRIPRLRSLLSARPGGSTVTIIADDPTFSVELMQWATAAGHRLLSLDARGPLRAQIELAPPPPTVALVPRGGDALHPQEAEARCTLLVLHNDREALLAALLTAVGAAAQGMQVMMFFTFWGLNLLRGDAPNLAMPREKVSWAQRMFKWMMPKGPAKQRLGKLDMAGIGRGMLGSIMRRYELMDIAQLMAAAEEQGVRFVACTMSMQVMGITKRDLAPRPNLDYGGVTAFVESAARSRMSLTF